MNNTFITSCLAGIVGCSISIFMMRQATDEVFTNLCTTNTKMVKEFDVGEGEITCKLIMKEKK